MLYKRSTNRILVMVVVFLFIAAQFASSEYVLTGPGSAKLVFDSEKFKFDMDYSEAREFYNQLKDPNNEVTLIKKEWTFTVGECVVPFYTDLCDVKKSPYHITVDVEVGGSWVDSEHIKGTVKKEKIVFDAPSEHKNSDSITEECSVKFEEDPLYPGKFVVDVSLEGEVGDKVVTKFAGAELYNTSIACSKENKTWKIASLVVIPLLSILVIALFIVMLVTCVFLKKSKKQQLKEVNVGSMMGTVTTQGGTTQGGDTVADEPKKHQNKIVDEPAKTIG